LAHLTSSLTPPAICDSATFFYVPAANIAGTMITWSRPAITGISNPPASGSSNPNEKIYNTTPLPIIVNYTDTLKTQGCVSLADIAVVVNPAPHLSSNITDTGCTGNAFYYMPSSATPSAYFYWSRPAVPGISPALGNGAGSISETLNNSTSSPVEVTYIYTITASGCSEVQNVELIVNPFPGSGDIITQCPSVVCANTQFQNFGTAAGLGLNYYWSASNALVWAEGEGKQYCLVNFNNPGNAVITLYSNIGASDCISNSSYEVMVTGNYSDNHAVIYYNGQFICLSGDRDSYQWGFDNASTLEYFLISGEVNQGYFLDSPDFVNNYYWVSTSKDGCIQKSYYNTPLNTSALPGKNEQALVIYPNPGSGRFTVRLNSNTDQKLTLQITKPSGEKILETEGNTNKNIDLKLDVSPGIYFISANTRNGNWNAKVVIEY